MGESTPINSLTRWLPQASDGRRMQKKRRFCDTQKNGLLRGVTFAWLPGRRKCNVTYLERCPDAHRRRIYRVHHEDPLGNLG